AGHGGRRSLSGDGARGWAGPSGRSGRSGATDRRQHDENRDQLCGADQAQGHGGLSAKSVVRGASATYPRPSPADLQMIIDCHAHLEPRMLELDSMIGKLDAAAVDRAVLIPSMNDPLPETPKALLAILRGLMQSGPGRLVAEQLHRALLTPEGDLRLSGKIFQIYARPDNAMVSQ